MSVFSAGLVWRAAVERVERLNTTTASMELVSWTIRIGRCRYLV
jgi:hypothetical protein